MDKQKLIAMQMEDLWHCSEEYKRLPTNISTLEYKIARDVFKAERINAYYGYEESRKFIDRSPHITGFLDHLVPCMQEPCLYQCTMFCHKYNFEKGCMLNATE